MLPNHSPWLHQLQRTRPVVPLAADIVTDIAVVGGGIAGLASAYFILRDTPKNVVLIEADKIAHGATGHNAGQITSYFERPFSELVSTFGLSLAADAQRSVESAWGLLDEIIAQANLRTPVYRFTGYAGCTTDAQLRAHLANNAYRLAGGLPTETILIAQEAGIAETLPSEHRDLYQLVPQADILALLETDDSSYIGLLSYQKGCMNSALLTEELAGYLLATYPDRFQVFEHSPMTTVALRREDAALTVLDYTVTANRVVLCTNGFEYFTIRNEAGSDINTAFHHLIAGRIGYMVGYLDALDRPPIALSYFPKHDVGLDPTGEPYFLLTRRPYEKTETTSYNLLCVAGPEAVLPNQALYDRQSPPLESARLAMDDFLSETYHHYPAGEPPTYAFFWHGLMGYTPNGIRRVGAEPRNPVLLYNLGCNGVGLLPSLYGGQRIAQIVAGQKLAPSIFDPIDRSE